MAFSMAEKKKKKHFVYPNKMETLKIFTGKISQRSNKKLADVVNSIEIKLFETKRT